MVGGRVRLIRATPSSSMTRQSLIRSWEVGGCMAKKTVADLDMAPLAIAERHAAECRRKLDVLWSESDNLCDKNGDNLKKGVTMRDFDKKMADVNRATNELFRAVDNLIYLEKHKDDPPTEPSVPEEDVRAVLIASFDDKTDELSFSVNSGLLASAVARAIRMDVSEDVLDPP